MCHTQHTALLAFWSLMPTEEALSVLSVCPVLGEFLPDVSVNRPVNQRTAHGVSHLELYAGIHRNCESSWHFPTTPRSHKSPRRLSHSFHLRCDLPGQPHFEPLPLPCPSHLLCDYSQEAFSLRPWAGRWIPASQDQSSSLLAQCSPCS